MRLVKDVDADVWGAWLVDRQTQMVAWTSIVAAWA